jgi:hypothetical protein
MHQMYANTNFEVYALTAAANICLDDKFATFDQAIKSSKSIEYIKVIT